MAFKEESGIGKYYSVLISKDKDTTLDACNFILFTTVILN
jgi:hypothetical protein